jgi:hypothetical protein
MKHGLVACGVLLSHFLPKKRLGQKKISGLMAEPTTQPLVWHSDPGYPLPRHPFHIIRTIREENKVLVSKSSS